MSSRPSVGLSAEHGFESLVIADQLHDAAATSHRVHLMMLFSLIGYAIMLLLCLVLIAYMRYNRNVALKGDTNAARKIILPAFEPMLWILGGATGIYTVFFCSAIALDVYDARVSRLANECFYSGRQFVFLLVLVFMLQKSVSIPALRRAVVVTLLLSTYTIPIVLLGTQLSSSDQSNRVWYWTLHGARLLVLVLYVYIVIRPPARATKRTLREYCAFALVYYMVVLISDECFRQENDDLGFTLMFVYLLWGSLCPLVIWRVIKADTEHWRGLGQRAVALQSLFRQKNNIHERISCQGLHLLIEMHRKYIIDFAYLELRERIGVGASAMVFHGLLHSKTPVAIKVYTPTDFTDDTVAEFSHEAALCGALNHPNIVKFYGMCVCPPTICLVSELCQGSLEEITCNMATQRPSNRQQFLINLGYMLDAARAVAYIHSFSPAFLHRDIKPSNFLVDAECSVKLTDFGESRSVPRLESHDSHRRKRSTPALSPNPKRHSLFGKPTRKKKIVNIYYDDEETLPASPSMENEFSCVTDTDEHEVSAQMTVKGTVDYMAPELIRGKAGMARYGEAADVYSLAITMWDILYPGAEKFPTLKNHHLHVFESVIDGKRPSLDPTMHPILREVIERSWQEDPTLRPSAQQIVTILESIQEEVALAFASDLSVDLEQAERSDPSLCAPPPSIMLRYAFTGMPPRQYSGQYIIQRLLASQYVNITAEALRMGHALMDAGVLHHAKHAKPFENAEDSMYYLDEEAFLQLLHQPPCAILGERKPVERSHRRRDEWVVPILSETPVEYAASDDEDDNGIDPRMVRLHRGASTNDPNPHSHSHQCACQRLGQRLEDAKVSRRLRLRRKLRGLVEENLLTTKLLEDEDPAPDCFEGFECTAAPTSMSTSGSGTSTVAVPPAPPGA